LQRGLKQHRDGNADLTRVTRGRPPGSVLGACRWAAFAVALALIGTQALRHPSLCVFAQGEPTDVSAVRLPEIESVKSLADELSAFSESLVGRRQAYSRALSGSAIARLAELEPEAFTAHHGQLVLNTVKHYALGPVPTPEEEAFRTAYMGFLVEALVRNPVTREDTETLKAQLGALSEQLRSVADKLCPEEGTAFNSNTLQPTIATLQDTAESLIAGGVMHPLSDADLRAVVSAFERVAGTPIGGDDTPSGRLNSALHTSLGTLYGASLRMAGLLPSALQSQHDNWMAAERKRREEERERDLARFRALVVRGELGSEVLRLEASSAVVDALALWHGIRRYGQTHHAPPPASPSRVDADVRIEFWEDGESVHRCDGRLEWDVDEGSRITLTGDNPGRWFGRYWDRIETSFSETMSVFSSGNARAEVGVQSPPPSGEERTVVRATPQSFAAEMATQMGNSCTFWAAVLPLVHRSGDSAAESAISLVAGDGPPLSPVMWNSQPGATRAVLRAGLVTLRRGDSDVVGTICGRDLADVGASRFPLTVELELPRRQVVATTRTNRLQSADAVPETFTAPVELDVRNVVVQLRVLEGSVLVLDEYKAYRFDDTPVCTVRFSAYELAR